MGRVQKRKGPATNPGHTTQGKFAARSRASDIAESIGNSPRMVAQRKQVRSMFGQAAQLQAAPEEELQAKAAPGAVQRMGPEEELQKKADPAAVQRQGPEEELTQGKLSTTSPVAQLQDGDEAQSDRNGLPDDLKSGIENLSGMPMNDVQVHYNSPKPAQLQALAYTQGKDIHVGPGQEQHLPHEAWHVVQQAQGRVQPTAQMEQGVPLHDDPGLEHEADVMGQKAKSAP